jgi:hypothetical protein
MMKKKLALAALAALSLFAAVPAGAQVINEIPLLFQRTDAGGQAISYTTSISDGNHQVANRGVAVAPQDTAIVKVFDHFYRFQPNVIRPFPGAGLAGDSLWFGSLSITGTSSTIDTCVFFRDVSPDGFNWTLVDSAVTHIVSGQVASAIHASGADSVRFILTAFDATSPAKKGVASFFGYPVMAAAGITAQALNDVNFIRFRVKMTPGDYAAAGTTAGLTGSFRYPAVKP